MYELFLAYFNQYPHKQWFFINNIIVDLKLPLVYVSKELEQLSKDYPHLGYYNPDTGWFKRLTGFKRKKTSKILDRFYLIGSFLVIAFFPFYYTPVLYGNSFFMLFGFVLFMIVTMILFHEIFDKRSYLKDYKL